MVSLKKMVIVVLFPRIRADMAAYWKGNYISSIVTTAYVATGNQKYRKTNSGFEFSMFPEGRANHEYKKR